MLIWFFLLIPKIILCIGHTESNEKKKKKIVDLKSAFSILCIHWIWILIPTMWFTNLWTLATSKKDCWIISQDCQDNSTISLVIFPNYLLFLGLICYLFAVLQHSNFSLSPKDLNLEHFIYFWWYFPFLLSHWLVAALIKFVMF